MAGYKNKKNTNKVEELIQNSGKKKKVSTSKELKKDSETFLIEIKDLREKLENAEDEKLRALAELENIRRRMQKEKEDSAKYGASDISRDLFEILDNLDRAIQAAPKILEKKDEIESKYLSLREGIELIQRELLSILKRHGIESILPEVGEKFDPNIHQAMMEIPREDLDPGLVCEILQNGYKIYDRLLRPAMVGVSKSKQDQKADD